MKSLSLTFCFGISLVLAACGGTEGSGAHTSSLGVEQGNGLASYSNSKLGIRFKYPSSWKLTGSAISDSLSLDNSPSVKGPETISQINFSISPTFFGAKIKDQPGLEDALKKKFPDHSWKPVAFSFGQAGFFWKTNAGASEDYAGEYYLLDQNYNILWISYHAFVDLGGVGVVRDILRSMTVDFTAPVVDKIYFEPATAHPGDTVKLVIETWDDVNDASIFLGEQTLAAWHEKYGPNSFSEDYWGGFFAVGHGLPTMIPMVAWGLGGTHRTGFQDDRYMGYLVSVGDKPILASAFPFVKAFEPEHGDRFAYTFKVPERAPEGIISAPTFSVIDTAKNIADFSLLPEWGKGKDYEETYRISSPSNSHFSTEQRPLPRPELRIVRDGHSLPVNEKPPVVSRVWFEKTALLPASAPYPDAGKQKMFLEIHSVSPIRNAVHYELAGPIPGVFYMWVSGSLTKEGDDIYSVEMPFTRNVYIDKLGTYPDYWIGRLGLSELVLADDVGNVFVGNSSLNTLPVAGFLLALP